MTDDRYKWVALSNTTLAVFMSGLDGSIVIIALPAIFRGIDLDPLAPGNIGYLLWMIMGYRLVQAVLVVTLGRLGDMYGRVRIYNAGFAVFAAASVLLSFDPFKGAHGAMWLIGWRALQALGGAMLMANSAAILTDAFPLSQRGFALGTNQIAAIAGQFIGLLAGGVLAVVDWRAVFWVNVPVGVFGTIWAYRKLRETSGRSGGRIDWWGNITFAGGLSLILIAITYGIQPYDGHTMGWTNPSIWAALAAGVGLLAAFVVIEGRVRDPMFQLGLFRIRAFTAGNVAGFIAAVARGGLQFMLIIWLQGIWLPLHGYDFSATPLWAGIYLLPMTAAFLVSGPLSGALSDRFGARGFATGGMLLFAGSFLGLMLLPVDFSYWPFAALLVMNGIGTGMFGAPNLSAIMSSVPAAQRGAASGMRSTFQNSGTALSIGVFFSLMMAGVANSLPETLSSGLRGQGVSADVAARVADLPPVSSLFAAVLGENPIEHLLGPTGVLGTLSPHSRELLTGTTFFPDLLSGPFHDGLVVVFSATVVLSLLAAAASLMRGGRYVDPEAAAGRTRKESPMSDQIAPIEAGRAALLVMDYQPTVLSLLDDADALLDRAEQAIGLMREAGGEVSYVRVAFEDADLEGIPATSSMGARVAAAGLRLHADSPGTAVHERLAPSDDDIIVRKVRVCAFSTTDLDEQLRDRDITTLVLAGVSTSGVVLSTVRDASDRDYRVLVLADACADPDAEVHAFLTERIFPRQAEVITVDQLAAALV